MQSRSITMPAPPTTSMVTLPCRWAAAARRCIVLLLTAHCAAHPARGRQLDAGPSTTRPAEAVAPARMASPGVQPAAPTWPESRHAPLALDSPYMTGDWFGARIYLEDQGLTQQLFYNDTSHWNVAGGRDRSGRHGGTLDWLMTVDFDKLDLIAGGRLLAHIKREESRGINPNTGALWEVADDLDGDRSLYVAQLWYEQAILDNRVRLRAGFLDYQTIVDRNRYANSEDVQFMNQALDNNPILPLNIGLGVALTVEPSDWFSLVTGIGDADPQAGRKPGFSTAFHDDAEFVWYLEPRFRVWLPNPWGDGNLEGNYRFGMVYDPRSRTRFSPPGDEPRFVRSRGSDYGFYASFDQQLFRESPLDDQGLGWFFRYGFRHGDINRVQNFWSTGLAYEGLLPGRDRDTLGMAVFQSIPSRKFNDRVNRWSEAETGFEMYYAFEITRWMVLTADFQYIASPGIDSTVDDAVVLGLRTRISF